MGTRTNGPRKGSAPTDTGISLACDIRSRSNDDRETKKNCKPLKCVTQDFCGHHCIGYTKQSCATKACCKIPRTTQRGFGFYSTITDYCGSTVDCGLWTVDCTYPRLIDAHSTFDPPQSAQHEFFSTKAVTPPDAACCTASSSTYRYVCAGVALREDSGLSKLSVSPHNTINMQLPSMLLPWRPQ